CPRLVNPQAIRSLWPITTPGTPENVKPLTRYPQAQCSPIWYQMPGMLTPRCGSLASRGAPVAVWSPATTHELEPRPSPAVPSSGGTAAAASATADSVSVATVSDSTGGGGGPSPGPASGTNSPSTTRPPGTIGACRSNG